MTDTEHEARTEFVVGLGLWGEFRDLLGVVRLEDPSVRWHEGGGWIERTFTVVGNASTIHRLNAYVASIRARLHPQ